MPAFMYFIWGVLDWIQHEEKLMVLTGKTELASCVPYMSSSIAVCWPVGKSSHLFTFSPTMGCASWNKNVLLGVICSPRFDPGLFVKLMEEKQDVTG